MKRVLILAYDFPPYVSVGSLRPYSWFKYFKEFGIHPIVVTRQWSNKFGNDLDYIAPGESNEIIIEENEYGTIVRTPYVPNLSNRLLLKYGEAKYRIFRKGISAWFNFSQYFLPVGPKSGLLIGARNYLQTSQVDLILATAEPYVLFSYASRLSSEFNIPWIADYRDQWVQNEERQKTWIHKLYSFYLEKRAMKNVIAITTVSDLVKNLIVSGIKNKPTHVLPNGFDPDAIEMVKDVPQQSKNLQVAFIGTIYKWNPIKSFISVLAEYTSKNPQSTIELFFYGTNISDQIEETVKSHYPWLEGRIHIVLKMPNSDLLRRLASHNVMLLFNYYSHMGTKIFDFVGIRRKILLCYSNDKKSEVLKKLHFNVSKSNGVSQQLQEDVVRKTNSGIAVRDPEHLYCIFQELEDEFNETGKIECNSEGHEMYSRKIQVKKLAEIIKSHLN